MASARRTLKGKRRERRFDTSSTGRRGIKIRNRENSLIRRLHNSAECWSRASLKRRVPELQSHCSGGSQHPRGVILCNSGWTDEIKMGGSSRNLPEDSLDFVYLGQAKGLSSGKKESLRRQTLGQVTVKTDTGRYKGQKGPIVGQAKKGLEKPEALGTKGEFMNTKLRVRQEKMLLHEQSGT